MAHVAFLRKAFFLIWVIVLVATMAIWDLGQASAATGSSWPARNITFIVPFKPGGGYDIQSRILAPFLEKYLPNRVNVIIKNVAGASGKTGIMEIIRSKPDGYTIGLVGVESVAFMRAMGELELDVGEWSWIGQVSGDPLMVAIPTAGKYKTVAEMKGQDIRFGVTHEQLASAIVLGEALGMKVRPILFDGSGDALLAGMRGDLDAITFSWPSVSRGVRDSGGKLTALFVVSKTRIPAVKDVPTLDELGVRLTATSMSVLAACRVVVGPAGLDKTVCEALVNGMGKAMSDTVLIQQMETAQQSPSYANGETVKNNVRSAVEAYTSVKNLVTPFLKK